MPDHFLLLSKKDQFDALGVAADALKRPAHLLEKDVWVVWALETLFGSSLATKLAFKGGTSLSKAFGVIRRFSEDVDLTYDIREIVPELTEDHPDGIPPTASQADRWTKRIRERLPAWIDSDPLRILSDAIHTSKLRATAHKEGDAIYIDYEQVAAKGTGYASPSVMLEFGARSTGEPYEERAVTCDAAPALQELTFPTAHPRTMRAERTFWEKATAAHVYCLTGRFRGGPGYSRHWHDLARLEESGHAATAIGDGALAKTVALHKKMFFPERIPDGGGPVDYESAVAGSLALVPSGKAMEELAIDYKKMVEDGFLHDPSETFEELMDKCQQLEQAANKR